MSINNNKDNIKYRPDIDGLRAIAVMAVILFHVEFSFLSGGFTGVDIFFVISGYLISSIIIKKLTCNDFSFGDFYLRRAKRLLPASFFMLLFTLAVSYFFLLPDAYEELSKSAIYATLFLANIWFMNNSGYFDLETNLAPLVHMWSLAVEEQFYFVFPLAFFLIYKIFKTKGINYLLILLIITSFFISVITVTSASNFSFYMLPSRAWELSIGGIIATLHLKGVTPKSITIANLLSFLGAILLIIGLLKINETTNFPGVWALFPVLGSGFIIYSCILEGILIRNVLSNSILRFVGKISYSTYLWHWPIVVFYRIYINERAFTRTESIGLTIASLILGYLSWNFIEEKFRYKRTKGFATGVWSVVAMSSVIIFSLSIYINKGYSNRLPESIRQVTNQKAMWEFHCTERGNFIPGLKQNLCVVGKPWNTAKTKALIWGDSHAQHFAPLLNIEGNKRDISFLIAPEGCPPMINSPRVNSNYARFPNFSEKCTQKNSLAKEFLINSDDISLVVMASAWSWHYKMLWNEDQKRNLKLFENSIKASQAGDEVSESYFSELIDELSNKQILLIGDIPRANKILNNCFLSNQTNLYRVKCAPNSWHYLDAKSVFDWHSISDLRIKELAQKHKNVLGVVTVDNLCNTDVCPTFLNSEFLYKDSNHLRRNLSEETLRVFSLESGIHDGLTKAIDRTRR